MSLRSFLIVCAVFFGHGGVAMAVGLSPDAGAMMQHNEQGNAAHHSQTLEGFPIEYYPSMRWNDNFSVQVDAVVIDGNTKIPNETLQEALKSHIGKRVSVHRFSSITRLVEKVYRAAGYQAMVYVPEQSFARGKLVIQVIER